MIKLDNVSVSLNQSDIVSTAINEKDGEYFVELYTDNSTISKKVNSVELGRQYIDLICPTSIISRRSCY